MQDSAYNGMFSVSKEKRVIYNPITGGTTHRNFIEKNKYDLRNENTYDLDGNIVKIAGQIIYNSEFLIFFYHNTILEAKEFLEYHYQNTPIIEEYLDYVEFGILPTNNLHPGIKGIMARWVEEKRNLQKVVKQTISPELNRKLEIAVRLAGYGSYNSSTTIQPVYHYIKDVLKEYKITPIEGREIVLEMKGAFSPEFNTNVVPFIIDHLKLINPSESSLYERNNEGKINTIPLNPEPSIFKNGFAFEMFLELKQLTVRENSKLADYSFIYNKMKGEKFITADTKQRTFITYLNKKHGAEIDQTKFPFKNQGAKQPTYNTILNRFKPLIESVP